MNCVLCGQCGEEVRPDRIHRCPSSGDVLPHDRLQRQLTVAEAGLVVTALLACALAIWVSVVALHQSRQLRQTCRFATAYQSPEMRALVLRANPWCRGMR